MPGVIGASRFSPRPARGYRFHSLQVEIIEILLSHQSINQSIDPSGHRAQYLGGASALTNTQYRNADGEVWHRAAGAINRNLPTMRRDSSKIVAWLTTSRASSPARFALAGENSGEEDRGLPKKTTWR